MRWGRLPWSAAALFLPLCCVVVWGVAGQDAGYVHDDRPAILDNANVTWPPPVEQIFRTSYFGPGATFAHMPLTRPLVTLSFAVEEGLGWTSARARHRINLLGYGLVCLLVGSLFARLASMWRGAPAGRRRVWLGVSALLFAAHPVHASVVMSVAYRPEIMALGFVLAASHVWLWIIEGRGRRWLLTVAGAACFGLALLCKESALCALAPWLMAAWLRPGGLGRCAGLAASCLALALGLLVWRHIALGGVLVAAIPWADNPLTLAGRDLRALAALEQLWLAATHALLPLTVLHAPDWSFDALPLAAVPGWRTGAGAAVVVAATGAVVWGLTGPRRFGRPGLVALAVVWAGAFYLPVSNGLFAIPVRFAERLLFAPSVAACALLAWPLVWLLTRLGGDLGPPADAAPLRPWRIATAWLPAVAALGLLMTQIIPAARPWQSELALYRWGVQQQPRSAKMRFNLGRLLVAQRREAEALPHLQIAAALRPKDWPTRVTLLEAHFRLRQCAESRALADAMEGAQRLPRLAHVALFHWSRVCAEPERARRHAPWLGAHIPLRHRDHAPP